MNWEAIFWLIAMVVFMIAEGVTVSLVSIWFALGALAALVVSLVGGNLMLQVILFLSISIILLASLRSLVRKYINPRLIHTNVDSVIGSTGVVTIPVNNVAALGRVTIGGMDWSARSSTGEPLPEGAQIRVDRVEGVKLFVSLAEDSAVK